MIDVVKTSGNICIQDIFGLETDDLEDSFYRIVGGASWSETVAVWLKRTGRKAVFVIIPMIFMFCVTLLALALLIWKNDILVIRSIAIFLFVLAQIIIWALWLQQMKM